jgi:hypothetical protein
VPEYGVLESILKVLNMAEGYPERIFKRAKIGYDFSALEKELITSRPKERRILTLTKPLQWGNWLGGQHEDERTVLAYSFAEENRDSRT